MDSSHASTSVRVSVERRMQVWLCLLLAYLQPFLNLRSLWGVSRSHNSILGFGGDVSVVCVFMYMYICTRVRLCVCVCVHVKFIRNSDFVFWRCWKMRKWHAYTGVSEPIHNSIHARSTCTCWNDGFGAFTCSVVAKPCVPAHGNRAENRRAALDLDQREPWCGYAGQSIVKLGSHHNDYHSEQLSHAGCCEGWWFVWTFRQGQ